jgi:hypothetical protein
MRIYKHYMRKNSIALNQNTEALSNGADFKKSSEQYKRERIIHYRWEIVKAENLKIALEILLNNNREIELLPIVNTDAFIEVVQKNLKPLELWLLNDLIEKRHDKLDKRIKEIKVGDDLDLYYEYHEYDRNHENVSFNHVGKEVVKYGDYVPNAQLVEMEAEREALFDLYSELNDFVYIEPTQKELEIIGQVLA